MPALELKLPQIAAQEADGTIAFNAAIISTVAASQQSYMIFYLSQEDEQNGYGTVIQLDEQHMAAIYPDLNPEYTYLFFKDDQGQLQTLLWCIEFATRNADGLYVAQAKVHGRGVTEADMQRFSQIMVAQPPANSTAQPGHDLAESYSPTVQASASADPAITPPAFTAPTPAPQAIPTPLANPAQTAQPAAPQWNTPAPSTVIAPESTMQPAAAPLPELQPSPDLNLPPLPDLNQPVNPAGQPQQMAQPASLADLGLPPLQTSQPEPAVQPTSDKPAPSAESQLLDLPPLPPISDTPAAPQPVAQPQSTDNQLSQDAGAAPAPTPQPVSFPSLPPLPTAPVTPQAALAARAQTHPADSFSLNGTASQSDLELPPLPPLPLLPDMPDSNKQSLPSATLSGSPALESQTQSAQPDKNPVGRPPKPLLTDAAWRVDQTDFAWAKAISRESIEPHKQELRDKLQSQIERNQPELLQNPAFQAALDQAFQSICQAYELAPTARQDLLKSLLNGRVVESLAQTLQ